MTDDVIKVTVYFRNGTKEEFYADDIYEINGGLVFWSYEGTNTSFPIDTIQKIVEK